MGYAFERARVGSIGHHNQEAKMSDRMKLNPVKIDPVELVQTCIEELTRRGNAEEARPMSPIAINCLRLEGKKPPPSLIRYLAYDHTFYTMSSDWGEFDNALPIGAETPNEWEPVYLDEEIERAIEALAWRPVSELKLVQGKQEPVSSSMDYLKLKLTGKLFRLPNIGNQTHFMYVGKADRLGEYPILGFEMKGDMEHGFEDVFWGQLNVWVKYPNFAVYLYDQIFDSDIYPEDFPAEMDEIYRNNPELM